MAELMEMPFEMWIQVGPRNHALDGVQISMQVAILSGKRGGPL